MSIDMWEYKALDTEGMGNEELIALLNGDGMWAGYLLTLTKYPEDWVDEQLDQSTKRYKLMKSELLKRLKG